MLGLLIIMSMSKHADFHVLSFSHVTSLLPLEDTIGHERNKLMEMWFGFFLSVLSATVHCVAWSKPTRATMGHAI